jgi:adenosine deaminase
MPSHLSTDVIRRAPKVLLHDHLDGGLRPATIVELAAQVGHELPAGEAEGLGRWFRESADSGSLERYLETFAHTVAVMQEADAIRRVARECVEDLAGDGVVYAEVRYAPEQHLEGGLSLDAVVEAVRQGFADGEEEAQRRGTRSSPASCSPPCGTRPVRWRSRSSRWRTATTAWSASTSPGRRQASRPPGTSTRSSTCSARSAHFTIHAGEAFGLPSIWQALQWCGADRLGHGVRIIDDSRDRRRRREHGATGHYVRDKRVPLEMCPSSNVQTGAADSIAAHPLGLLTRAALPVTVNTDNR